MMWLSQIFPRLTFEEPAPFQIEFMDWLWAVDNKEPEPFISIWFRGSGKSTWCELAAVYLIATGLRKYVWYVRGTQDQANASIQNINALLERSEVDAYYPGMAERLLGKFGQVKGWRRDFLRTATGGTFEGIGLDTSARGSRVDENRPDVMIFDDIDHLEDSSIITDKKERTITHTLLPALQPNGVVMGVQNRIIPDGVFSRLENGTATWLAKRRVSGPYSALNNMSYEQKEDGTYTVDGDPTWNYFDKDVCTHFFNLWGPTAFLREAQHEVSLAEGGMFNHLTYSQCRSEEVPPLLRVAVWCDPAVTNTDRSDACAIQVDGLGEDMKIYRLFSYERQMTPYDLIEKAILKAVEYGGGAVGVETDQGGDTWETVYRFVVDNLKKNDMLPSRMVLVSPREQEKVWTVPAFKAAKAGSGYGGKVERAGQMLTDYETGRFVHVNGTHMILEHALNRFPAQKPFDLVDACDWSWFELTGRPTRPRAGNW